MNTIVDVAGAQVDVPVVPAEHPDASRKTWVGPMSAADVPDGDAARSLRPQTAPQLLRAASDVIEERTREYDKPGGERSIAAVVTALNAILGRQAITESEGWLFMRLLKDVRLFSTSSYHADSGRDGIAYQALMCEAKGASR